MQRVRMFSLSAGIALWLGLVVLIAGTFGDWLGWIGETTAGVLVNGSFAFIIPGGFFRILEWSGESPEEQRELEAALAELKRKWQKQGKA